MAEEELKIWFLERLNNCYPVIHKNYKNIIFWYYSDSFVRKKKLCTLSGVKLRFPVNISGKCLFEQDINKKKLYCDYEEIWSVLYFNYSRDYQNIENIIKVWLKDSELSLYLSKLNHSGYSFMIEEDKNMLNSYTPSFNGLCETFLLNKEFEKLSVYDYNKFLDEISFEEKLMEYKKINF